MGSRTLGSPATQRAPPGPRSRPGRARATGRAPRPRSCTGPPARCLRRGPRPARADTTRPADRAGSPGPAAPPAHVLRAAEPRSGGPPPRGPGRAATRNTPRSTGRRSGCSAPSPAGPEKSAADRASPLARWTSASRSSTYARPRGAIPGLEEGPRVGQQGPGPIKPSADQLGAPAIPEGDQRLLGRHAHLARQRQPGLAEGLRGREVPALLGNQHQLAVAGRQVQPDAQRPLAGNHLPGRGPRPPPAARPATRTATDRTGSALRQIGPTLSSPSSNRASARSGDDPSIARLASWADQAGNRVRAAWVWATV